MDLNPEIDLAIDVTDLTSEFRRLSLTLFRYYGRKADAERDLDIARAHLKETKATVYKLIKSDSSVKRTESAIEAEIETHPSVVEAVKLVTEALHTAATYQGAVESMKAKKDMLVQLGADSRKDRG